MSECKHEKADCIDTRQRTHYRKRRYKCRKCGERWTTAEIKIDSSMNMTGSTALVELQKQIGLSKSQRNAIELLNHAFGIELANNETKE